MAQGLSLPVLYRQAEASCRGGERRSDEHFAGTCLRGDPRSHIDSSAKEISAPESATPGRFAQLGMSPRGHE